MSLIIWQIFKIFNWKFRTHIFPTFELQKFKIIRGCLVTLFSFLFEIRRSWAHFKLRIKHAILFFSSHSDAALFVFRIENVVANSFMFTYWSGYWVQILLNNAFVYLNSTVIFSFCLYGSRTVLKSLHCWICVELYRSILIHILKHRALRVTLWAFHFANLWAFLKRNLVWFNRFVIDLMSAEKANVVFTTRWN